MSKSLFPALALHGGAGNFPRGKFSKNLQAKYEKTLLACLDKGWRILEKGGPALDAVEVVVRALEDSPLFNAGRGSVLNEKGRVECDAALMAGDGRAGAVAGVCGIKNPISLARTLLQDERVVLLAGKGAERYARARGFKFVPESYFITPPRVAELKEARAANLVSLDHAKFGTVGAVARDRSGALAAATSTGGLTNKAAGRIGDSPIIGAGTYACNETCAISCTGVGEIFIREVVGHEISARMRHGGQPLAAAAKAVVHDVLAPIGGVGGVIAVGADGAISLEFNSESLYRAWRSGRGQPRAGIF
ncbi:MAG TPA: isoaspartyl peptidase/L-asparaginase [Chthoniobacterales bacterium]